VAETMALGPVHILRKKWDNLASTIQRKKNNARKQSAIEKLREKKEKIQTNYQGNLPLFREKRKEEGYGEKTYKPVSF